MSEKKEYMSIPKQELLDAGLNVFGLDLVVESLLRSKPPEELCIFYPVNRKDCEEFTGVNIRFEPVRK